MSEENKNNQSAEPNLAVVEMAKEMRSAANKMTDEQRAESFRFGMQLIYGGDPRKSAQVRCAR
jgi:hypothetical protein